VRLKRAGLEEVTETLVEMTPLNWRNEVGLEVGGDVE
jgi:hypothetical protein